MNFYDIHDRVRLDATFTTGGSLVDPTTVTFDVKKPNNSIVTYLYPTTVSRVSLGLYRVEVSIDRSGTWHWDAYGTGVCETGGAADFGVRASHFP